MISPTELKELMGKCEKDWKETAQKPALVSKEHVAMPQTTLIMKTEGDKPVTITINSGALSTSGTICRPSLSGGGPKIAFASSGGEPKHAVPARDDDGTDDDMPNLIPVEFPQVGAANMKLAERSSSSIPKKSTIEYITTKDATNFLMPSSLAKRELWHRRVTKEEITGQIIEDLDLIAIKGATNG